MSRRALCRSASLCLFATLAATTAHAANYVRSYLVDNVLLPTSGTEANSYAIDVDGDGFPDNGFGQVLAVLSAQGFDFLGSMDAAVASGSIVHLVGLQSTDVLFKNDPAAQATWCVGVPTATPPLFNGTDNPSCADTSGIFVAALSGGSFTSPAPASTPNPVYVDIELAIGTSHMTLTVLNARLSFTTNAAGNMPVGQINGYASSEFSVTDYLQVQRVRTFLQQQIDRLFDEFDVLATAGESSAASPLSAPPEEDSAGPIARREPDGISSLCGLPALSVPCGFSKDRLPFGVQFIARALDDHAVIAAAHTYQWHTDWHRQHPSLS